MINRILIRIKVVQLLYSYMLTRSEFKIEPAPEKKTRDSKFAYATYIDTLYLILKLSGYRIGPDNRLLALSSPIIPTIELARSLASNSDLLALIPKEKEMTGIYENIVNFIADEINESGVYADYTKKKGRTILDEVSLWTVILESLFLKDNKISEEARRSPDFTIAGLQRGIGMAIDTLRNYMDIRSSLFMARKSLDASMEKAHELYHALLMLPVEITRLREEQLDIAKEKYLPSAEDLNPNMRFINNRFVKAIADSEEMAKYFKAHPFSWETDYFLIKKFLDEIIKSNIYEEYMTADHADDWYNDCEFWRRVFKDIILPSDELAEALESKSVYWNDDIVSIGTFVIKSIKRTALSTDQRLQLMPMFKDEEDANFGERLFSDSVTNAKEYRSLIDKFINEAQWDSDRLALMDIVILTVAISELLNFPAIPIVVTLNEYIEIANYYSTPRSGQFINGILYSVINYLRAEGRLLKDFETKSK